MGKNRSSGGLWIVLAAAFAAGGLPRPARAAALTAPPAETGLQPLRTQVFDHVNAFYPEAGAALGLHSYDSLSSDFSAPSLARYQAGLESLQGRLEALAPRQGSFSDQDKIDFQVAQSFVASQLHHWRDAPDHAKWIFLEMAPYARIQTQVLQMDGPESHRAEWEAIASRLEKIPAVLLQVRERLQEAVRSGYVPNRAFIEQDGIAALEAAGDYFEKDLPAAQSLSSPEDAALLSRLRAGALAARAAYADQAVFLRTEILPHAQKDHFALGEREYAWRLKNELGVDQSPLQMRQDAQALADRLTSRMQEIVARLAPGKTLAQTMDEINADSPKNDQELFQAYDQAAVRARQFVIDHKLFDAPNAYDLKILPTPKAMRATMSAGYLQAPPLDPSKKGIFVVTPSEGSADILKTNNFPGIPVTVVHEAFPGHDLQYFNFQHADVPPIRYLDVSDASAVDYGLAMNVEGYAHYAENLMLQRGFYKDYKEELSALQMLLFRAYRIVVDSGLHAGGLDPAEASRILTEKVFLPKEAADGEVYRYTAIPTQAVTYALGRLQIESLKAEYEAIMGPYYKESEFHQAFLNFGPVPPAQIRPVLLARAREERARRDAPAL